MKNTSLCYIERDGQYLMLHRIKKARDENRDKWIGIGGKFEPGESPEDCVLREVREETGLRLTQVRYCGIITFVSDRWQTEYMHLFHATGFTGRGAARMDRKGPAAGAAAMGGRLHFPRPDAEKRPVFLAQAAL